MGRSEMNNSEDNVPDVLIAAWNNEMLSGEEWDAIKELVAECDRLGEALKNCSRRLAQLTAERNRYAKLYDKELERATKAEGENFNLLQKCNGYVTKLQDIATREWRDEGGRIAAAIARDGLAACGGDA